MYNALDDWGATANVCSTFHNVQLRDCHTLAITVNDRVTHGKILNIIENAGDYWTLMIKNDCLAFVSA